MIDKFKFQLFGHRQGCDVCGGITEKFQVIAVAVATGDDESPVRVCELCLAKNADRITTTLKLHADAVEEGGRGRARRIRSLIGQLKNLPTHAEWQAEHDYTEARYGTGLTREQWDSWTPEQRQAWKHHGHQAWMDGNPMARVLDPEVERPPLTDKGRKELDEMFGGNFPF